MSSKELSKNFGHNEAEAKWYQHWMDKGYFYSSPDDRPAYTIVMPPPNVTGIGTKKPTQTSAFLWVRCSAGLNPAAPLQNQQAQIGTDYRRQGGDDNNRRRLLVISAGCLGHHKAGGGRWADEIHKQDA